MVVAALPVVASRAALLVLGAAGVSSIGLDLAVLTMVNAVVAAGRFILLRAWVFG
jgi:hypothetical protein